MKTDLTKFNNNSYWKNYNDSSTLKRILWFLIGSFLVNGYLPIPISFKIFILRIFGAKIGTGLVIKPKVNIKFPWLLTVGNNCWIGEEVWIDNLAKVIIGDNVCISQGALLLTGNHNYSKSSFDMIIGEIVLENGVWIGAKSIVGPNVICKSHSVLSVGSVATKNLEQNSIYRGNPAVFVKQREIAT